VPGLDWGVGDGDGARSWRAAKRAECSLMSTAGGWKLSGPMEHRGAPVFIRPSRRNPRPSSIRSPRGPRRLVSWPLREVVRCALESPEPFDGNGLAH
jgi:hypothetical protein